MIFILNCIPELSETLGQNLQLRNTLKAWFELSYITRLNYILKEFNITVL